MSFQLGFVETQNFPSLQIKLKTHLMFSDFSNIAPSNLNILS